MSFTENPAAMVMEAPTRPPAAVCESVSWTHGGLGIRDRGNATEEGGDIVTTSSLSLSLLLNLLWAFGRCCHLLIGYSMPHIPLAPTSLTSFAPYTSCFARMGVVL